MLMDSQSPAPLQSAAFGPPKTGLLSSISLRGLPYLTGGLSSGRLKAYNPVAQLFYIRFDIESLNGYNRR